MSTDALAGVLALAKRPAAIPEAVGKGQDLARCGLTDAPSASGASASAGLQAEPAFRRTSIALSPLVDEIAARLLAEYKRKGKEVSLGKLVEMAIRELWTNGQLPDPDGQAWQTAEDVGGPQEHEPMRKPTKVSGGAKRVPLSEHKILAVVISVAETGEQFMRTYQGPVPVRLAELQGLAPAFQVVSLGDLHSRVEAKAEAWRGDRPPPLAQLYVSAVSGHRCEFPGCNQEAAHIHHRKPRAEGGDHRPGNIFSLCQDHHLAHHEGLVRNPGDPPPARTLVAPGESVSRDAIDRAVQAVRNQATALGFKVA